MDKKSLIEKYANARVNAVIDIKKKKEEGKKVVGTFCAFTPKEVIIAAKAIPLSLCGMKNEPISEAEKHLSRNLCPLIKSSYGHAITDTCPYFYFSDLLVGETTCDGKKKMYEYLNNIKEIHVMQLPQTLQRKDSLGIWQNEIVILAKKLEKEFHVEITNERLQEAIRICNKERLVQQKLFKLGMAKSPVISGYELLKILQGIGYQELTHQYLEELEKMIDQLRSSNENINKSKKRILVTGCPLGADTEKVIKIIEDNEGIVVAYENCTGLKAKVELVDENVDPYQALAAKYLNVACPCISPNKNRMILINELIKDYKVDGVIDIVLQSCHPYSVETYGLKNEIARVSKVPYMSVETDYSSSDVGQLMTRIGAFLEML
jgi:benzoyl-CoA reductase/2-hydroxyglutaryl-CoA dehydratase subunit BcrC/BadD/HgdB